MIYLQVERNGFLVARLKRRHKTKNTRISTSMFLYKKKMKTQNRVVALCQFEEAKKKKMFIRITSDM